MADIKKRADLMHILPAQETRLKKVERQLAVARQGKSASAATETFTGSGNTGLSVNVVLTSNCLIHVYAQMELKSSTPAANVEAQLILLGEDPNDFNSVLIVQYDGTCAAPTVFVSHTTTGRARQFTVTQYDEERNQMLTFPNLRQPDNTGVAMAAGKYSATLLYATTAGTLTIKNQSLFVSVEPFQGA